MATPYSQAVNCIVLVKQVPDVSNIPEDAWDREKGTLRRAMLDSILNPLDLHALTFADRLTRVHGLDYSPEMLNVMMENAAARGLCNV